MKIVVNRQTNGDMFLKKKKGEVFFGEKKEFLQGIGDNVIIWQCFCHKKN
jgi:hypothetical protein